MRRMSIGSRIRAIGCFRGLSLFKPSSGDAIGYVRTFNVGDAAWVPNYTGTALIEAVGAGSDGQNGNGSAAGKGGGGGAYYSGNAAVSPTLTWTLWAIGDRVPYGTTPVDTAADTADFQIDAGSGLNNGGGTGGVAGTATPVTQSDGLLAGNAGSVGGGGGAGCVTTTGNSGGAVNGGAGGTGVIGNGGNGGSASVAAAAGTGNGSGGGGGSKTVNQTGGAGRPGFIRVTRLS